LTGEFTPHTGAVIDRIRRSEPLTEREQQFADWAEERGLAVVFSKEFPMEEDDVFDWYFTYELAIEEFIDGKVYAQFYTVLDSNALYPEMWPLWEQGLRAAFERTKSERVHD